MQKAQVFISRKKKWSDQVWINVSQKCLSVLDLTEIY